MVWYWHGDLAHYSEAMGCKEIADSGVTALAGKLPATLRSLNLNFTVCEAITGSGVAALADKIPSTLQLLKLPGEGFVWTLGRLNS